MEDIQSWIDASASLRKSPNEPLQLDPVIATSVSGEDLIGKEFFDEEEAAMCKVTGVDETDDGIPHLIYDLNGERNSSAVSEVRKWVLQHQKTRSGSSSAS